MPTTTQPKRKKKPGAPIGNTTSNGNGGNFTESAMDEFLAKQGLYRKPIAKDGSCLFRAVSEQVHNCQGRHLDVRNQCIEFMRRNRMQFEEFVEGPFDHHLYKLQNPKEWAGQVEITALSKMFSKDFVVYQDINSPPTKVTDHGYKDKILLCYSNGNHYDIIYNNRYQEHAAMCQSLLFEMLYNKVFASLDKKEAAKKGKPKVSSSQGNQKDIMDLVNGSIPAIEDGESMDNGGDDDGWTEVKSKARVKHERHSKCTEIEEEKEPEETKVKGNNDQKYLWELKRSIDPHLYRNIPLEVWEEDKHLLQQKDMAVAVSLQFKNGERCSVKLGPPIVANEKLCNAIIKEDYTGSGSILVYVPELSKRHTVPIQSVSSQQSPSYKELSGHYQKDFTANGPATEEGAKDDSKFKKKRPPRNRRGPGKGVDEQGNANEEVQPRGRGKPRDRYRHRFPGRKDDRRDKEEEEARFMAEQIKLVEIQEKDPMAFPALPVRASQQVSPPAQTPAPVIKPVEKIEVPTSPVKEDKIPETEKDPTPADENTPAGFWSKLTMKKPQKPLTEETKSTPSTTVAKQQEPESTDTLNANIEVEEVKQPEDKHIKQELFTKKENVQDKEIDDDNQFDNSPDRETSQLREPLPKITQVIDDTQHSRRVFEVEIPGSKVLKPVNITPTNLKVQPDKDLTKHSKQIEPEPQEDEPIEDVKDDVNIDELQEEMTGLVVGDDKIEPSQEVTPEKTEMQMPDGFSLEETFPQEQPTFPQEQPSLPEDQPSFHQEQPSFPQEEEILKAPKPRDNTLTPERKTVTFAEETKEIPDVPYGQNQKGILMLNGTNRPEQGYKTINTDDYSALTKENSKQDYNMAVHENPDKDHQMYPSVMANENMQSSSPTTQQQLPPFGFFLPHNVQLPARASMDPNGSDLPQDIPTLRHFFNLGYQYYMIMANQMANQQLPLMYMYQPGALQDQMMQQAPQPVVSMQQQQLYGSLQHQHAAFQPHGLQTYPPFHMPSQTSQDNASQLDRTSDRSNQHQSQVQPQPQIQMPHQQQSGHFQQQQSQMQWRNNNPGGSRGHYNKMQHHNMGAQPHRPTWSQGNNQRQQHNNNKQNRKPPAGKTRNDHYTPHYSSSSHAQSMAHNAAVNTPFYSMTGDHQSKPHSAAEYYPMYPPYHGMQPGMPHPTGPRGNNY